MKKLTAKVRQIVPNLKFQSVFFSGGQVWREQLSSFPRLAHRFVLPVRDRVMIANYHINDCVLFVTLCG